MNGRLLLLVLVTAMFMAAWDGDQAAMEAAFARRAERQASLLAARSSETAGEPTAATDSPLQVTTVSLKKPVVSSASHRPSAKRPLPSTVSADDVPLPETIAAGTYRAVNQSGETVVIIVAGQNATALTARDFYIVDAENGDRWFLVRVVR